VQRRLGTHHDARNEPHRALLRLLFQ
jgi:hypothetical protein